MQIKRKYVRRECIFKLCKDKKHVMNSMEPTKNGTVIEVQSNRSNPYLTAKKKRNNAKRKQRKNKKDAQNVLQGMIKALEANDDDKQHPHEALKGFILGDVSILSSSKGDIE